MVQAPSTKSSLIWLFFLGIESLLICSSVGFIHTPLQFSKRNQSYAPSTATSPNTFNKIDSLATSPRRGQFNYRYFVSKTVLFKRNKNSNSPRKWQHISSINKFLPRVFSKKVDYRGFKTKNNAIEVGVETALVLGNKQRRTQWTKEASKKFSWIPPKTLSRCIDGLASAFAAVAPKDLQVALQSGGLERVRFKIEADLVRNLRAQPIIKQLPLPKDEKNKLVEFLVDLSLDFFMKDLESALAAPSVKLRVLDQERHEILQYMSFRQLASYRLRHKTKRTIALGLCSFWTVCITLWFLRQNYKNIFSIRQFISLVSFPKGVFVKGISNARSAIFKHTRPKISWLNNNSR